MQFLVIGRDGDDGEAAERRAAASQAHRAQPVVVDGRRLLYAATLLDGLGATNGSIMIFDCAGRAELDDYLEQEPYVVGKVWNSVEISACSVPDQFAG